MSPLVTIRHVSTSVLAVLLWTGLSLPMVAQKSNGSQRNASPHTPEPRQFGTGNHPGANQEHLQQWMEHHRNLTPQQQQKALEHEPGFRDLPSETQQRFRDHLTQLNNMPPERRQRFLDRNEAMARLSVPQRQQVRDAMKQFSGLPVDRRHQVARAFRDLRQMPEPQRQAVMNSESYRSQFSDQERGALSNLLSVEPYHVIFPNQPPNNSPER